jgi:hypothetical protein
MPMRTVVNGKWRRRRWESRRRWGQDAVRVRDAIMAGIRYSAILAESAKSLLGV